MKFPNLLVVLIILIITGCVSDTLTGIQEDPDVDASIAALTSQQIVKLVPLKGTFSGVGSVDMTRTDCPIGSIPIRGEGNGTASHFGKIKVVFSHCSYFFVDPTNPTYVDGRGTLTTVNGDEIRSTYFGNLTSPDSFIDYNTIVGGTGRFEYASGSFTETGSVVLKDQGFDYVISFAGKISTVGSSK